MTLPLTLAVRMTSRREQFPSYAERKVFSLFAIAVAVRLKYPIASKSYWWIIPSWLDGSGNTKTVHNEHTPAREHEEIVQIVGKAN